MPAQIGRLGRYVVAVALDLDSTLLQAMGGVWHAKQRQQHLLACSTLDVEADWGKSGWHE